MAEYEKYLGKYTRTSAEKYEEFLKELDVSWPLRKLALASTPVLEVILFTIKYLEHHSISHFGNFWRQNSII